MIDLNIKDKKDCTGCYACVNICPINCIKIINDEEGFGYPKVEHDKCIKCGKCVDVCPIINKITVKNNPVAYACINKDEPTRFESSSGGVFTLIAEQIIVDGGIVFGAGFKENFEVEHSFSDNKGELNKFRGSKYVQSIIGESYNEVKNFLLSGRLVLFSGTPCQIGGLKSFLGKSFENLICVDFICHGVPSPDVWNKYIKYREEKAGAKTQKVSFRSKNKGWKKFGMSFIFKNNTEYFETFDKDLYMRAFLSNLILRPSCYACEFKSLHRQSDITLADFWGIEHVLPEIKDDKGTSLVFINSKLGQNLIKKISNNMLIREVNIDDAVKCNSSAIASAKYNLKRENFFKELNKFPFNKLVKKYCNDSLQIIIKRKSKTFIYNILKQSGLLSLVKSILKRN